MTTLWRSNALVALMLCGGLAGCAKPVAHPATEAAPPSIYDKRQMDLAKGAIVQPVGMVSPPPYPDAFVPGISASIVVTCAISPQGVPQDCLIGLPGSAAHPILLDALVKRYAEAARYPAIVGNAAVARYSVFQIAYDSMPNKRLLSVSTAWLNPYALLLLKVAFGGMRVTLTYTCDSGVDGVLHRCMAHDLHPQEDLREMAVDQLDHTYYWIIAPDGEPLAAGRHDFSFSF